MTAEILSACERLIDENPSANDNGAMDSRDSVKQTIEEVEALTGCPVQIAQDSSIMNMAVLDIARSWELQRQEGSKQTTKNTKYTKVDWDITTEPDASDSFRVFRGSNSGAPDSGGSNSDPGSDFGGSASDARSMKAGTPNGSRPSWLDSMNCYRGFIPEEEGFSGGRRMTSAELHAKLTELLRLPAEVERVEFKEAKSELW